MLNNIGASTLLCGSPFFCRRQRLFTIQHHEETSAFEHCAYQVGQMEIAGHLQHFAEEESVVDRVVRLQRQHR